MRDLLVVAGEQSGDAMGAAVLARLQESAGPGDLRVFGMGGAALAAAGTELVHDLRSTTAMGLGATARRGLHIAQAFAKILHAAHRRKPRVALLINYTEFNTRLAAVLHARGVRILWYGAPQIWAWREARAEALRPHVDRMAVILPFEEELWRERGVDAHYVGHPAQEAKRKSRHDAREALGLTERAKAVALLPGSRPHEVKRLLPAMIEAYERVRHDRASVDGRLLLAASLDTKTRELAEKAAADAQLETFPVDPRAGASLVLPAFDASLCASGTASLEAVLARAVPVVSYRVDLLSEALARRMLTTPTIALPNVLLGRPAFVELVQGAANPLRMTDALADVLDRRDELLRSCDEVEATLGPARSPSREVANLLLPWLA